VSAEQSVTAVARGTAYPSPIHKGDVSGINRHYHLSSESESIRHEGIFEIHGATFSIPLEEAGM
jgi:hypothetical protein